MHAANRSKTRILLEHNFVSPRLDPCCEIRFGFHFPGWYQEALYSETCPHLFRREPLLVLVYPRWLHRLPHLPDLD